MPEPTESAAPNSEIEEVKTPEQDETAGTSASPEGENEPEEKKPNRGIEKRFAKLTSKLSAKEQEAEFWKAEALKNRREEPAQKPAAKVEDDDPEPNEKDYETKPLAEYLKAVRAWDRRQIAKDFEKKAADTFETKSKANQEKSEAQKAVDSYNERQSVAKSKYDDYDEVIAEADAVLGAARIDLPAGMKHAIMTSEVPELTYFLSKNPDELIRIAKLNDFAAAREIGKIEARIAKEEPAADEVEDEEEVETPKPPVKPTTQAPPPPTPIKKTSPTDKGLADELDTDEWIKRRNAQISKR